ncbi:MAG: hypothetical protein QG640_287 [Patescibacteria group bacterium]|nr:hypothetical protein [Patescibacteria group bacterium]
MAYTVDMNEIMKSEWFFFISSIGFVVIGVLLSIIMIYTIRALHAFTSLIEKMESEVQNLGTTAQELLEDFQGSFIYRMIFKPRRRRITTKK